VVETFIAYHQKKHQSPGGTDGGGASSGEDSRPFRVPWQAPVSIRFNSHADVGKTRDISTGGLYV